MKADIKKENERRMYYYSRLFPDIKLPQENKFDASKAISSDPIEVGSEVSEEFHLSEETAERIIHDASDYAITAIQENYSLDDILSNRNWASQRITDFITEYVSEYLESEVVHVGNYKIASFDVQANIGVICDSIDWDYIYDTLEECAQQPTTIYDKLRDIGMTESDFL